MVFPDSIVAFGPEIPFYLNVTGQHLITDIYLISMAAGPAPASFNNLITDHESDPPVTFHYGWTDYPALLTSLGF
jgi:hypothetical protein